MSPGSSERNRTAFIRMLLVPDAAQMLAQVRSEEGYMAEIRKEGEGSYLLVENHCPICAAANACQGFCSTELDLFRSVLGSGVSVERAEHIIKGDQRCVYLIKPQKSAKP